MSARRALVTGATGFVGGHLVRRLAVRGWEVSAVVRPGSRADRIAGVASAYTHDGSTEGLLEIVGRASPDVVFHLGSLFIGEHRSDDVEPLIESNLLFGTQLLEGMRVHGCTRLVNTGTAGQHYEGALYNPSSLYAATKAAFLTLLRYFEEVAELRVVTLELYESYGPEDVRPKLMTALLRAAREGTPLPLSAGWQRLDLVHVQDIARAFEIAAERLLTGRAGGGESFAVRSGQPRTVREVVELFARMGKPIDADWGARPYRSRELMSPWTGGETLPGWTAEIDLENGIRELIRS